MRINFASTRLAFFLIASLLALIILSAVIPQRGIAQGQIIDWQETLGDYYAVINTLALDQIFFAPYFFIVLGLLAINLIFCKVKRFRSILKLEKTLLKARHLGSIIFHLSLLLIMAGVILNYLYKFEGIYGLTEGQTANDIAKDYHRQFNGPFYSEQSRRFAITLDKVYTDYVVEAKETNAVEVTLHSPLGDESTEVIYLNKPYEFNGLEFHLGPKNGYSPELLVSDTSGMVLFRSFVRLSTQKTDGEAKYVDYVLIDTENLKVGLEAIPQGTELDSTLLEISVEKNELPLYLDTLAVGEVATVGGHQFSVPRLRRWSYIDVLKSPYLGLVFFGFWSAIGGMVIGFVSRLIGERKKRDFN